MCRSAEGSGRQMIMTCSRIGYNTLNTFIYMIRSVS